MKKNLKIQEKIIEGDIGAKYIYFNNLILVKIL